MMLNEGIFMSKNEQFNYRIIYDFTVGKIKRREAATLTGKSERTISRLAKAIRREGMMGIKNGNLGKTPHNKTSKDIKLVVQDLIRDKYFDLNVTHCLEKLHEKHGFSYLKYPTLLRWMHELNMVKRRHRRSRKIFKKRARMPAEGLMLQMDGSHHQWNRGSSKWCLIAAIDDATSDIPYAEFFLSEDTLNCMTVMQRIIEKKGIPESIYVDKAGCLGGGKRAMFNQFKRACEELGIRIIFASSPQAKGRIERAWDTFQDRLIPEMRLEEIKTIPAANKYLDEVFLPEYWDKKIKIPALEEDSRYRTLADEIDLKEIFCIKEFRTVKNDHTFSYNAKLYQITGELKYSIRKQKIEIRKYQSLEEKFFFAGREIEVTASNQEKMKLVS